MPIKRVVEAFNEMIFNKPIGNANIHAFLDYYSRTWLSTLYPLALWNHHDTIGPRTNNHVEGENAGLNRFVNTEKLSVYLLIECLKDIESQVAIKYFKNEANNIPQKRRREDDQRDQLI